MRLVWKCIMVLVLLFSVIAPASAETLRILAWEGETPEVYQQKFIELVKEKYGIDLKLDVKYVTGNDDFFPALRDNTADIIFPSHHIPKDKRFQLIKFNLVLPLNLDNIPNFKNVIPFLQKADYCAESGKVYCAPRSSGPYGLFYNTEIIKEEPKSWNILWDPKYKGKYAVGKDQYELNIYITALAMGMAQDDIFSYRKVNKPDFQKKLERLATNAHSMWLGVDKASDLKGLALAAAWGLSLPKLKEMGETWKMAEPKEGTTAWIAVNLISHALKKKPRLKRIAEEWLNYILGDEYQTYLVRGIACMPVTTSVKDNLMPEEIEQFHLDNPDFFQKYRILWRPLEKMDRKGFQRLWKNALKKAG